MIATHRLADKDQIIRNQQAEITELEGELDETLVKCATLRSLLEAAIEYLESEHWSRRGALDILRGEK